MRQGFLFSPAIEQKELAIQYLQNFELLAAQKGFKNAIQTDPFLAEIDSYLKVTNFLLMRFENKPSIIEPLVNALIEIRQLYETNQWNRFAYDLTERLLSSHILKLLAPDFNDFLSPHPSRIHSAYCFLVTGQHQIAREKLLQFLSTDSARLNARLWGYLGDASWHLHQFREAEKAYLHALIIDAAQIDFIKLRHPKIRTTFQQLQISRRDENGARQLLPVFCWFEQVLSIPKGPSFLTKYAENELQQNLKSPADRPPDYRRFALCLFIDQAGVRDKMDWRAREEMSRIDHELFEQYLARINPPKIKETDARIRSSFVQSAEKD